MTKKNQKIVVPISEQDLEDLQNGEEFNWTFPTESGEEIDILIRPESEEDFDSEFTRD